VRCKAAWLTAALIGAGGCTHPGAPPGSPRVLGAGVTLAVDAATGSAHAADSLIPVRVTLTNRGEAPIKVKYCDFALSGGAEQRYEALLPAELSAQKVSASLLPEGIVPSGQSRSGFLYFRVPPSHARPTDLRVDLEAANDTTVSRTFLPVHFK
jgi:hypothetical protein